MTRSAKITVKWADGDYDFRMGIGELEELEEKTRRPNADGQTYTYIGPVKMFDLLIGSNWLARDVRETLRIGLIGGGTKPVDARRLIERYVDEIPDWHGNARLAAAVVGAALSGYEVEDPGKSEAARGETTKSTHMDDFPSPPTTQTQQ